MLQARKSRGERLLGRVRLLGEIRGFIFYTEYDNIWNEKTIGFLLKHTQAIHMNL